MASVRRDPRSLSADQRALYARARGAFMAAERVAPGEGATVPLEDVGDDTSRAVLALSILRDAAGWALAATESGSVDSLAAAWDRADATDLERAAGGAEQLARVRTALLDDHDAVARATRPATEIAADLTASRAFVGTLIDRLDRRVHAVARVRTERWVRILGTLAAVFVLIFATNTFLAARRPDLAPTARWVASSTEIAWGATGIGMNGPRGGADVFFHTRDQENPWIEFDLGRRVAISRVVLANRIDCCQDRAVPAIIEVSDNRRTWVEVARRDDTFNTWDKTFFFRPRARYVRLRVPRRTILHLARVEIH